MELLALQFFYRATIEELLVSSTITTRKIYAKIQIEMHMTFVFLWNE